MYFLGVVVVAWTGENEAHLRRRPPFVASTVGYGRGTQTRAPAAEKKFLTADLADNTSAVFQLLSATLTQGNMSRLGRCELNSAAPIPPRPRAAGAAR